MVNMVNIIVHILPQQKVTFIMKSSEPPFTKCQPLGRLEEGWNPGLAGQGQDQNQGISRTPLGEGKREGVWKRQDLGGAEVDRHEFPARFAFWERRD